MTDLMTRWTASHDRLNACQIAVDEARRAGTRGARNLAWALASQQAAIEAHYLILDEQNAAMDAADRAEEAAAVAEAMRILSGK